MLGNARDGAIIFADLIGKLDLLRVACEKCGRWGSRSPLLKQVKGAGLMRMDPAMPNDTDFTKRIIPLFVIVMIAVVLVISMLW